MAMRFVQRFHTASGAVVAQIVNHTGRTVTGIEQICSTNSNVELGCI